MQQNEPSDSSSIGAGPLNADQSIEAFSGLERRIHAALETYSNVHRGCGHFSMITTHLFERARGVVLEYLGLESDRYIVIFCTPLRLNALKQLLDPSKFKVLSDQDTGLPLGVRALAVERDALPKGAPYQSGGGTTKLVGPDWVIWADAPERFEAGTPAIINIIAFAVALQLKRRNGDKPLFIPTQKNPTAGSILYHDELDPYSGPELLERLRKAHIGRDIIVPAREGEKRYVNLDNGASTPTFTPVWNAVALTWQQPENVQKEIITEVRSVCSRALGASPGNYDVIFTSNTTEAINLLSGFLKDKEGHDTQQVVLNSLLEHNSNDLPWRRQGFQSLVRLGVDRDGFIDMIGLESILSEYNRKGQHGKQRISLVAVSGASNVLGVFNDLSEISRIVHSYGALLLVDGAQMVAHREVDMEKSGIDFLAFSAHKVYAPFGTGVLVARKGALNLSPAELDLVRSSGEENPGGIAALGKSLVLLQRIGFDLIRKEEQSLTARALKGMSGIKGLRLFGIKDPESPAFAHKGGVIIFELKGKMAFVVAGELTAGGIGIRYGCHCAHLLVKHILNVPHALEQFQRILARLPGMTFPGVARVSLGLENVEEDIDKLIDVLGQIGQPRTVDGKASSSDKSIRTRIDEFARARGRKVYC
ncbi:MAG: aminotransferase class V-fold PLP-dependent enzyme [Bacteroidales bacterium]